VGKGSNVDASSNSVTQKFGREVESFKSPPNDSYPIIGSLSKFVKSRFLVFASGEESSDFFEGSICQMKMAISFCKSYGLKDVDTAKTESVQD